MDKEQLDNRLAKALRFGETYGMSGGGNSFDDLLSQMRQAESKDYPTKFPSLEDRLSEHDIKVRVIHQFHDETLIEVSKSDIKPVGDIIKSLLTNNGEESL